MCLLLLAMLASQPTAQKPVDELADERLILEAVLHDPRTIRLFGGRRMQVGKSTSLSGLHPWVGEPKEGLRIRLYETQEVVEVPGPLLDSARQRNRRPSSMKGIPLPPRMERDPRIDPRTEKWERIDVSRPGVSKDGLTAIVAITRTDFAAAGYTVYLQKRDGQWRVAGEGGLWVV